ncbi:M1 family metallopeptidase [Rhodanobacter sp. Col0626]|uniref:M1 family metallopeptidase n=1 Tax=Rhodanobacter sp. Col0626 TaxID=3415679 RepID=UPI003CED65CC
MQRLACGLVFMILAGFAAMAVATDKDVVPLGQLPRWAVPESYRLAFKVDPAQKGFSGTAAITLKLEKASDHLWLNAKSLSVASVVITDNAGKVRAGKYMAVAPEQGVARIDFGSVLPAQRLTVTIDYSASYNEDYEGLYKVIESGSPYTLTQMESLSARLVFPGFDEPGFKTPFDIRLTIPTGLIAVANTRQLENVPAAKGWKTLTFARTLPLPTYLVAFGVGPWDIAVAPAISGNAYRTRALPLRSVNYAGQAYRMRHVLSETPSIIHALEDYYGFGYPWDKLDLLDIDGGMENPGLVVLGDVGSEDKDRSVQAMRGSFNLAAHELAHQWTGDTVTMAWWNDIWLSEALTTWMQQKVTMQVHPEYRADLERVSNAQGAMANDSLSSARRIRQPIEGNGDILTAFDDITYQKGASVVGMFENYVGEKVFQKGMRAYIQKYKFGNAVADDLVSSIAQAAGAGESFKRAFNSFLDKPGVPYVQASLAQENGKTVLNLSQSRYLPVGSSGDSKQTWGVPVCVRYGTTDGSKVNCRMFDKSTDAIVLEGASNPTWVMPNANASGYYRFGLTSRDLAALTAQVGKLSDTEQLVYADAIDASFRHGDIDAGDVLSALKPLAASDIREVAMAPLAQIGWIYRNLATNDAQRNVLANWVKDAYLPRLERLGYQRKAGESENDAIFRNVLVANLAFDVRLPEVRTVLLRQGDAVLDAKRGDHPDMFGMDRALLGDALGVALQEHGKSALATMTAMLYDTRDPAMHKALIYGLSRATGALAEQVRNIGFDKRIDAGEMFTLQMGHRDTADERDAAWHWFTAHYPQLLAHMGGALGNFLPRLAALDGCSQPEAERLQSFFKSRLNDSPAIARGLAQIGESIQLCSALKAKQNPAAILR